MEDNIKKSNIKNKISNIWNTIWNNKWYPFLLLSIIFTIIMVIIIAYPMYFGGFFHMNSDDLVQYYPYISGFFSRIKSGSFSLYDKNLFGGVSIYSAAYYIPLDIFTLFAFLLSYFMEAEIAYAIMNYLRVFLGALLLYYTFQRKFTYKTSFIVTLIYFAGGLTEAYYIFPVYLGICFYLPLGILIIDLCIEKKGIYYLLLPLYTFTVILYDFYIAYMLLAFTSIYFVVLLHINNEFSFFKKENCFLWNFKTFKRFIEYLSLVFLGVLMAGFIIIPSTLYILNETARNNTMSISDVLKQFILNNKKIESYRYFSTSVNGIYKFSFRHYFTQIMNIFTPNNPHQFCLVESGDYIREHASFYITCGGLIYFIYFFFTSGKKENRLKGWIIFLNLIFLIPLFCVLFNLNTKPYVRWFFIPYMFNLMAIALSLDNNKLKEKDNRLYKYVILFILFITYTLTVYVFIYDPKEYIHYSKDDPFFYVILIPTLIFTILYLITILISIALDLLDKDKNFHGKVIPYLIFIEFILASFCIFSNVENTSSRYFDAKKSNQERLNTLKESFDYKEENGYRINLYTIYGRESSNLNIQLGNANFGRFFQSFYNDELKVCLGDLYDDTYSDSNWSYNFKNGYSLISSPMFNVKYIISNENISLPSKYYNLVEKNKTKYYELKDDIPFIVYDKGIKKYEALDTIEKMISSLNYIYLNEDNEDLSNFPLINEEDISFSLSKKVSRSLKYVDKVSNYYVYEIDYNSFKDVSYISLNSNKNKRLTHGFMYLTNEIPDENFKDYSSLTQLHYNTYYGNLSDYKYLLVEASTSTDNHSGRIYSYSYDYYDEFIERQKEYTNKSFTINKNKMHIKCHMPDKNKSYIIKTGYTYSNEWKIKNKNFKTCNCGGGFLGIIVCGVDDIDIELEFIPNGLKMSSTISIISSIIYLSIIIPSTLVIIVKKKRVM